MIALKLFDGVEHIIDYLFDLELIRQQRERIKEDRTNIK